ncbi:hypothetical protein G6F59_015496 [Rhizopus arrhizus]|nr:hypothetical protein G6F59_015496 [Rhizopus arrhizus]
MPVTATTAAPEAQGRLFYNEDMSGFNFRREQVPLKVVLATLLKYARDPSPPSIYVASTTLDSFLPGLAEANPLQLGVADPLTSIWIGNRSRIAAHQEVPDNLACVAAGRRRVTLRSAWLTSTHRISSASHASARRWRRRRWQNWRRAMPSSFLRSRGTTWKDWTRSMC